jgi:hypothetical protein
VCKEIVTHSFRKCYWVPTKSYVFLLTLRKSGISVKFKGDERILPSWSQGKHAQISQVSFNHIVSLPLSTDKFLEPIIYTRYLHFLTWALHSALQLMPSQKMSLLPSVLLLTNSLETFSDSSNSSISYLMLVDIFIYFLWTLSRFAFHLSSYSIQSPSIILFLKEIPRWWLEGGSRKRAS